MESYPLFSLLTSTGYMQTYGGIFVVMSLLWGWLFDRTPPGTYDVIGALIILAGVSIIYYWPRKVISMIDLKVSLALFFLAALFEIGGGYLVWLWLRENRGVAYGLLGGITLTVYGIIPTFQPAHFGRVIS